MREIIVGRIKKLRLNSKSLFLFNKNSKQQKFSFTEYFSANSNFCSTILHSAQADISSALYCSYAFELYNDTISTLKSNCLRLTLQIKT